MTFIAAIILYKMCKRPQFGPLSNLFLRICSERDEVIVHWDTLRFAPGSYKIKQTKPLGRIVLDRLKLKFVTRIRFIEKETDHEPKITGYKYITPWQARTVKQIIQRGTYTITLIVTNKQKTVFSCTICIMVHGRGAVLRELLQSGIGRGNTQVKRLNTDQKRAVDCTMSSAHSYDQNVLRCFFTTPFVVC